MSNAELIQKEIDGFLDFATGFEERVKKLRHPGAPAIKICSDNENKYYHTTEYQQACQQILNDLSDLFFSDGTVDLLAIEKVIINNLDHKFPRVKVAELMGISVRTVRNKLNGIKETGL